MKKYLFLVLLLAFVPSLFAQKYEINIRLAKSEAPKLYLAQHYRDGFVVLDSASQLQQPDAVLFSFKGKRNFEAGTYALIGNVEAKKSLADITIDGSQKFSIAFAEGMTVANPSQDIKGSPANQAMFTYINRINDAKARVRDIEKRKKSSDAQIKAQAEADMQQLTNEMELFEKPFIQSHRQYRFFQLLDMFNGPDVPEDAADKSYYFRSHYWDGVDLSDHSLVRTPDLFNKMNLYFFGLLYHADKDTICKYADNVLQRIEGDTLMLRYFMDYIMPKYYRSTKNIGWDATWCYLVRKYYLTGKCAWAKESEIANKRQSVEFLEKSLIGARGAELWMADTNQSENPSDWISSHRFPQRFVILWFWDPDCHHCQEQTATLKTLYDSLSAAGNKLFEVYAIGYESDVDKWKRYVREHQLPFVNVGGPNVNIDYQEAYNVHGAPTMIILNEERRIIMNKTLPTKSILPFLRRYEQEHPLIR